MITGKEDLLQALIEAFIMEKGTKIFYDDASAKSVSADAKRTFTELAAWENKHMLYIQSLYQSILDDRELEEFREFSRHADAPVAESGALVKDLEKKIERHPVRNEQDALSIAMSIESKAYNLYKTLAGRSQDPSAKVIFEEMMAQETKHMDQLKAMKSHSPSR